MKRFFGVILIVISFLTTTLCGGGKELFRDNEKNVGRKNTSINTIQKLSVPQNVFIEDFENGFSKKWDKRDRFIITNEKSHSGDYSAKSVLRGNQFATLIKNIPLLNDFKIDLYVYISEWEEAYGGLYIHLDDGTNGKWQLWSQCGSYLTDCNQKIILGNSNGCKCWGLAGTTCINFPKDTWNHVVIEKSNSGNLKAWINDQLYIEDVYIGKCPTSNIYIMFGGCCNNSRITGYIDDVTITYPSN